MKPLIVKNLSCKLNLGAQFNHQIGFIPQKVIMDNTSKKINVSKLDGIRIHLQFQDVTNRMLRSMVGDSEFDQWLQKEPPEQKRGIEDSPPHTLHVIQQEKPREKKIKKMLVQNPRQEEEDLELEQLVDWARLTTAAQFYDKNEKAGLVEINPAGLPTNEKRPKAQKKIEPIVENIPPWSKESVTKYMGKVRETLTLLQQGKDDVEIFVGNNTKERNRKEMVTGMLQEHLQKMANVSLKRTPSQATELLDTEPQNQPTKKQQEPAEEGQTINHTEEIKGKRYQAMPEVDV